jgi:hypothetical protein|nr:MAG TPA: hypothetical protein [Caudoviricetes sp.]
MNTYLIKKENENKDIFTREVYEKEYEIYQSYPRFNVYNVYKVYPKTKQRIFLYRITKLRTDFGRRIRSRKDLLAELNKSLEVIDGTDQSRGSNI